MKILGVLLAVCASLAPSIRAASVSHNETSKIYVHIPFQLHDPDGFHHVQAEFGFSTMSGSLAEYVYYLEHSLCTPLQLNKTEGYPVHEAGLIAPFILLANDGSCSAVTKARHAQQVGASALIIASDRCVCEDTTNCAAKDKDDCEKKPEPLVNDGSGSDISIPTFLIYQGVGQLLKDELKNKNQSALMELVWGLPPEGIAQENLALSYHLWTTAHDPLVDMDTYYNLRTVAKAFAGKAQFAPRYSIIDGKRFRCDQERAEDGPCDHLCTNGGRYCAVHAKDLSGHAIVKETLRRLCIWNHYGDSELSKKPQPDAWWEYILYHKERCSTAHEFANEGCVADAMKYAHVDAPAIESCMLDAGDVDTDNTNSLLEDMLTKQKQSSVVALPAITLNQRVLDHMSSWSLFDSLCFSYWNSNTAVTPPICETCYSCPNKIGCVEAGHCVGYSGNGHHHIPAAGDKSSSRQRRHGWGFFWFFIVVFAAGGGAYYYYKQQQDRNGYGDRRVSPFQEYLQLHGDE
jgi:PA domain